MIAMTAGALQFSTFLNNAARHPCQKCKVNCQVSRLPVKAMSDNQNPSHGENSGKRTWRRRRLSPKKRLWRSEPRIPFMEEQERMIQNNYVVEMADINKLMKAADNKYELVLEIAAEATEFQINNKHRSSQMHPLSRAISDRMNADGFERPDGYIVDETYGLVPDTWLRLIEC